MAALEYMITSPYIEAIERPTTLFDLIIFLITGALLMQEASMIPTPIPFVSRRVRHDLLMMGSESRHVVGVTSGLGSVAHAQLARDVMRGLLRRLDVILIVDTSDLWRDI